MQFIAPEKLIAGIAIISLLGGCGSPSDDDPATTNSGSSPVAPSLNMSANPTTVVTNGSTTLTWNSGNADQCTASGDWSGSRGPTGTEVFNGITSDRQYTLSCEGPGGTASETVNVTHTTGNIAPVANAGPDQNVISGNLVNLNGNGSSDANGDPLTYAWTLTSTPAGSGASLANPTSATPSFVADIGGIFTVSLVVNDGTVDSNPDTVTIVSSTPVAPSLSLSANPTAVATNGSTTLSWDSDNADQCTASGDWSGSRGLTGSQVFNGITSDRQYTLSCEGPGGSVSETVNVTHIAGNVAPVANAGPDQNVNSGNLVNLNGNGSSDANGDPLTYAWILTSTPTGSSASLDNPALVAPSFVADTEGTYVVSLVVNDGTVDSNPDTVTIVATGGSGSFDCTSNTVHCVDDNASPNQEYSIIQNAVNISQPGDVVLVFDGNYAGFRVSNSGTSTQRIRIVADGNNANIVSSEPFGDNAIRIEGSSNITIDGFRIDRAGFSAGSSYNFACIAARGASASSPMRNLSFVNNHLANCAPGGMYLSNVKNLNIAGNTILNTDDVSGIQGMGIYLANASVDDAIVVENKISGSEGVAIHMNGDSSVGGDGIQTGHQIRRNVFENNGSNGLNMDGVQNVLIENNLFANNAKHAIRGYRIDGGGGPLNWVVVNNTFYNNESAGKATEDSGGHVMFNNVIVGNLNNGFLMNGANFVESNNVYSNNPGAIFVDAAGNDLRLMATAPAVDGGTASFQGNNAPGDDISGTGRSGNPDAGAFELGSSYPDWY